MNFRDFCSALLLCLFVQAIALPAQQVPKREFRGVWLTTLSGLDWPSPADRGNAEKQKSALKSILDNIARMKLNAVMFQVRSRGNAFYFSSLEPWAAELSGSLGKNPGWDPLEFAVDECHKRGLEIHAWVNVFKVWSGGSIPSATKPEHVTRSHPAWMKMHRTEFWLDPGIPDVRTYTVTVLTELAERYDIDALHLDYVRYPDADFNDADTWRLYGSGTEKAKWRRENINTFMRDLYMSVTRIKPKMKIGSAPIGIYKNISGAQGWEGYTALAQDARLWMREGYQDYVAPQIYWGLKSHGSAIDFEALVGDWKQNSSEKHVYAGMAPYKENVKPWLAEHIDACRQQRADGEVYFRYEHIRDGDVFRNRYTSHALTPAMHWRDNIRPNPPRNFIVEKNGTTATLRWSPPVKAVDGDNADMYAVYRSDEAGIHLEDAAQIVAVLPSTQTTWTDARVEERSRYAVTALDRFRNESDAAEVTTSIAARGKIPAPSISFAQPALASSDAGDDLLLIGYEVSAPGNVRVRLMDERGAEVVILVDEMKSPGTYLIGVERGRLFEGIASVLYEEGTHRILQPFPN